MAKSGPPLTDSRVFIDSIRTSQPDRSITQSASVELMRDYCVGKRAQRLTRHIARQSGVHKRHLAAKHIEQLRQFVD